MPDGTITYPEKGTPQGGITVSYTHLDVYKRQVGVVSYMPEVYKISMVRM